jgi:pimeloyl-ACP methyl ester carboxylesterase
MDTIATTTGTLAYDERGSGSGPAVVLLPSGAHDRHDYDELRELLPPDVRTIALDWPAHGDSPAPVVPASAMAFADAAQEAVAVLAPEGAVVVGNSIGGFAAARLAIRRPDLVRGLVLIDSGAFARPWPHERLFCALMGRPRFLRAVYPLFSWAYMRSRTTADRRSRAAAIATTRRADGAAAVAGVWRSFNDAEHDLRSRAGAITAPTLVIWGRRDPVIPVRVGRRLAASIPGARLAVLDTGHVPHTSDPAAVAAELTPFLASLGQPAAAAAAA